MLRDRKAQDLAEYGIALGIIGAGTILVAFVINGPVLTLWQSANAIVSLSL
jgi:hypothetical protein